ncbi:MAG TPA: hypothetical protein DFR83_05915 [Deltaproteobacteria bacterium]|nr:hypothetical protein [Deltaproteobacteria bacterium]
MRSGLTIWDPNVAARLSALELQARTLVTGFRSGGHRSRRVNSNIEFADYKPYTVGDPLRDLDWRIAARSERLVVRRHHAEEELAVTMVVDASADMGTGTSGRYPLAGLDGTKWSTAAVLAATLAHWVSLRGDPVGLSVLAGDQVRWNWLPPRGGSAQLGRIHRVLAETRPDGRADLGEALLALGPRVRGNSLVVILSDLMEPVESWGPALDALAERRCDVRLMHIYDRQEWTLRPVDLTGAPAAFEGGPSMDAARRGLWERVQEAVRQSSREARSSGSPAVALRVLSAGLRAAVSATDREGPRLAGAAVPLDAGLFYSPEGGVPIDIDPAEIAPSIEAVVEEYLEEIRQWLARSRSVHVLAPSSDDLTDVVAQLLRGV